MSTYHRHVYNNIFVTRLTLILCWRRTTVVRIYPLASGAPHSLRGVWASIVFDTLFVRIRYATMTMLLLKHCTTVRMCSSRKPRANANERRKIVSGNPCNRICCTAARRHRHEFSRSKILKKFSNEATPMNYNRLRP